MTITSERNSDIGRYLVIGNITGEKFGDSFLTSVSVVVLDPLV